MCPSVICKSLIDFILFWFYFILLFPNDFNHFILYKELEFLDWPSIYAHSPAGVMYIVYGLVILVHRNIKVTTLTIGCIQFRQGFEC